MAGVAKLRCFVALDLPPNLKAGLTQLIADLRASPIGNKVHWVRPEGIHLTLKFLGEVERDRRNEIETTVQASLHSQPFELNAGGLGVFPKPDQPRVIWVGLGGDLPALRQIQSQVETALATLGFAAENRAYSPHLTLGRVAETDTHTRGRIGEFLQNYPVGELARFRVVEAVLMESVLHPEGAIYTPLTHFQFG